MYKYYYSNCDHTDVMNTITKQYGHNRYYNTKPN